MGTGRGRRLSIRLTACAGVGAVVTVGVAWGIAWRFRPYVDGHEKPVRPPPGAIECIEHRTALWVARMVTTSESHRLGIWDSEFGWPAIAMRYRFNTLWSPGKLDLHPAGGLEVYRGPYGAIWLPLRPLFPGFALDTAFYAAIALTLWSAPRLIRRRLRRARRHCPACGYDLKGNTSIVCPECGASPKREGVAEGRGGEEVPSASAHDR
jgi:hypothetical protein